MDTFFEQIVKKKKSFGEVMIIVATVLVALAVMIFSWQLPPVFPFVVVGAGYGAWWLISSQNKEYEYCVTNGDIDIDLIISKRKRKRIVSVVGHKIEALLPYRRDAVNRSQFGRVVIAAPSDREDDMWYFTYHSKKNGATLVVFTPTERVLKALYGGLQAPVRMETDRALFGTGKSLHS